MRSSRPTKKLLLLLAAVLACAPPDEEAPVEATRAPTGDVSAREIEAALAGALAAARAGADSVIRALQPVALMRPGEEAQLRRYGNAQHLARARALGVRPADSAHTERLLAEGRLVRVSDSTELYVVRPMSRSSALLTPDALALVEEIGRRFQRALGERGLPAYRIEITSMLRSAAGQAALRRVNPNAAAGTSTHEYGTTMDIAYESWAAPARLPETYAPAEPAWLTPYADAAARAMLEYAAARKSRELKAILGGVLREMQTEGLVMVTLERQQPVYHLTVARRFAASDGS